MRRLLPNKFIGLGVLLLFLLYFVGPVMLRRVTGTPLNSLGMPYVSKFLGLCFWSFLLYLYSRSLKRVSISPRKNVALTSLPIVFVFLISGASLYNSLPSVRAQKILAGAQFAPLPASASQIKVLAWYTPFSGEEYLRFHMNSADIKSFLEQSPVLEHVECEECSDKRVRLLFSSRDAVDRTSSDNDHQYISEKPTAPPWYRQEIRDAARQYRIRPKGYDSGGELIIEEKTNLVFIKLVIS